MNRQQRRIQLERLKEEFCALYRILLPYGSEDFLGDDEFSCVTLEHVFSMGVKRLSYLQQLVDDRKATLKIFESHAYLDHEAQKREQVYSSGERISRFGTERFSPDRN